MKIKNGNAVLGVKDTRIGNNFVLTEAPEHYCIQDINARFQVRVHKTTLVGRLIALALQGEIKGNYLNNLTVALFEVVLTAHDTQSLTELIKVCHDATKRHPELYGKPTEEGEKADEEALQEQREITEIIRRTAEAKEGGE